MDDLVVLSSTDFNTSAPNIVQQLWREKDFTDVTLVTADNHQITAHKAVISSCSPLFRDILLTNPHPQVRYYFDLIFLFILMLLLLCATSLHFPLLLPPHPQPLIYLRGVQSKELYNLLEYVYLGQVTVHREGIDRSGLKSYLKMVTKYSSRFLILGQELQLCGLTNKTEKMGMVQISDQNGEKAYEKIPFEKYEEGTDKSIETESVVTNSHTSFNDFPTKLVKLNKLHQSEPSTFESDVKPNLLNEEQIFKTCLSTPLSFSELTGPKTSRKSTKGETPDAKHHCEKCPHKFQTEDLLQIHMKCKHSGLPEVERKIRKRRSDARFYQKIE